MKRLWLVLLGLAVAMPTLAVHTSVWQVDDFQDFLRGHLSGVSLSQEGTLRIAPRQNTVFNPNEALALSIASDRKGDIYLGTGHQGKVFRLTKGSQGSLLFTAHEPDIFALAVGPEGDLYVGSSPDGKIYRVTPDGKSSVFYEPGVKYIWALAFDSSGRLYAGTGDQGKIIEIDPAGRGKVFFESHQTHIMCLTFDSQGNLLAGSAPNGLVYRIDPQGKAFVLYQASLQEIHALTTDPAGHIYAAALGGLSPGVFPAPAINPYAVPATVPHPVVTVTAETGGAANEVSGTTMEDVAPAPRKPATAPSFNRPAPQGINTLGSLQPSHGEGALMVINPDATVDTLWSSKQESIFGLVRRGADLLFSTSEHGQIYDLKPSSDGGKLTLLAETNQSMATRLLLQGSTLYAATSNIAELVRLGPEPGTEGTYVSEVKDTRFISHWGTLSWRAETPPGTSIELYTRSGNFGRPDNTWSDWSGPYRNPNGNAVQSPAARYIQWKAVLHSAQADSPSLDEVSLAYLNQNLPPEIRSLSVSTVGERVSAASPPASAILSPAVNVGVSAVGPNSFLPPPEAQASKGKVPIIIAWQADDPNDDPLEYSLYVRSSDERGWHLLKDHLHQTSYTLAPEDLPDGRYVARLVASDAEGNPPGEARTAELLSAPFWVDNTPPRILVLHQQVAAGSARVQFQAADDISPLNGAQFSIDGKPWQDINSDDGIVDSRMETFTIKADHLKPGEHVIELRAYDSAGNVGVGKAVLEAPASDAER